MATVKTTNTSQIWSPDVTEFGAEDAIPEALIVAITTHAATIEGDAPSITVPVVTDDAAKIVAEGAEIDEAVPTLSEKSLTTVKIAKLMRLSREQFFHDRAADVLADAAARSIIAKADDVLLNQEVPTPPATHPGPGLIAQGLTNAGTVADDLDVLIDAVSTIRTNGGRPSHIVLSPTAWASLTKFKVGTGSNQNLLGAGVSTAQNMILGIPVMTNAAVPANSGLILDRSDIVSAYGAVNVAQSSDAYFTHDSVALRITFRFGAALVHPNRHCRFVVTDPSL